MATGSEGLNLQKNPDFWPGGASYAIMMDLWWSPARNEQAEARIHRQGANEPVTVYILQNNDSVDAFIAMLLEEKSRIFSQIMEADELRPVTDWALILGRESVMPNWDPNNTDWCCDDCGTDLLYLGEVGYWDPEYPSMIFCETCTNQYKHTPTHTFALKGSEIISRTL